jgi:hypothetical protein
MSWACQMQTRYIEYTQKQNFSINPDSELTNYIQVANSYKPQQNK